MAERTIVTRGNPILTKVCRPVTEFNDKLHTLLDDMQQTLTKNDGYGLAAPQVGILRRVVVLLDEEEQMVELVNPEITATSGSEVDYEGCLSVPNMYGLVERPTEASVRAQDRNGEYFEFTGHGTTARCICHELEHLDGHLFVEHTDRLVTGEEMDRERQAKEEAEARAHARKQQHAKEQRAREQLHSSKKKGKRRK